ncbi:uncharacterized protein C3orf20 isoform X2 [Amphiprion ocellaris]|uniref:uncharacterized protein C3orf20 isoform X2 n=1 Tax=Amphiprion ocellaris TaxID=80972 RepID=UPI002410DDDE|nr:uncharacterized protein C3orf20 isoform X2 [Amphiprion ocellaris]
MTSELRTGPFYFFDQPSRRNRIRGTRSSILHFNMPQRGPQLESNQEEDDKEGRTEELNKENLSGETCEDGEPDPSSAALRVKDPGPLDAYQRAAPQLLDELARLLSQHKWSEEGCIPRGVVNILNYSWHDLTAGALHLRSPNLTDKRRKSKGSPKLDRTPLQVSASAKEEAGERDGGVVGNDGSSDREAQLRSKPRVKKRNQNSSRAHNSTTCTFSVSSGSCKGPGMTWSCSIVLTTHSHCCVSAASAGCDLCPGWVVQVKQPSHDEPQQITLCQWVVERLQAARNPGKLPTTEQDLSMPLILRHYGDVNAKLKGRRRKAEPATLIDGMPRIPEVKQEVPVQHKLHYRINDGSSFIYYPSGCMAVCQSHSGRPCGGFYTNVFTDDEFPVILATITAFGRGTVTHPVSSDITAAWDQEGGLMYDNCGNITKEWSWQTNCTAKEKIVIQLSDMISVRLFSGSSAMLSFRCDNESVQLPLSSLSNIKQSQEMSCLLTEGKYTSDAAQDLLLRKTKCPAVAPESNESLMLTAVSVGSQEVLQMVREVEGLEDLSALWRRGGHVGRELKRLQRRVRNAVEDWLDYYRMAIGIKCLDTERMPDAPLRTKLRREIQSAALPSLNPPQRADAKPAQPEEGRDESRELHRHLSAPAERPPDSPNKLQRSPKKQAKKGPHVTMIGPLQIHGNIKLESVFLPIAPDLQTSSAAPRPAEAPFAPSIPLTVCPALLRAALQGEGQRTRRCCCSATLMPVVTDLEYDAFIMGQPPHSQQILVVCVTLPHQPVNTHTVTVQTQDKLEELYRSTNKHRTTPCAQCQMDSFRLVKYEMSTGKSSCGFESNLLQQRHNAAPGMVLMYNRGKLLFVGYIFNSHSCSARDLQKQISRTRGDYRLGLSLPSDYKFSDTMNNPAATDAHDSSDKTLSGGDDFILIASEEKEMTNTRRNNHVSEASLHRQRDFCIQPKSPPAFPPAPVILH